MRPVPVAIALAAVGVAVFGTYHWFFVAPVAAVFVEGILWALAVGAAVGWAYQRVFLDRGRTGVRAGLLYGALLAALLVPYEVVGLVWGPFPDIGSAGDFLTALPVAFVGVPFAVLVAWLLADRRSVAWPFVVAATLLHFMVGGSVAFFGGRGATAVLFGLFVVLEVAAGGVLGLLAERPEPHSLEA